MEKSQIDALKTAYKQVANDRVQKWERLDNEGMIERAKADAVTGFGMLCSALDAVAAAAPVAVQTEPLSAVDRAALGWDDSLVATPVAAPEYRTVAAGDAKCRHLWVVTQVVGEGPGEICTKCGELRLLRAAPNRS